MAFIIGVIVFVFLAVVLVPALLRGASHGITPNSREEQEEWDRANNTNYPDTADTPYVPGGRVGGRHGYYHRQRARREEATAIAMRRFVNGDLRVGLSLMEGEDGSSEFDKQVESRYDREAEALGIWSEEVRQNLRDNPHFYDS